MPVTPVELAGLVADLPPSTLPANVWSFIQNVGFPDGILERGQGWGEIYPGQLFPPRWLLNSRDLQVGSDSSFWLYPADTAVGVIDANTAVHTDITGAEVFDTSALTNPWTGGLIQGVPVINSVASVPYFWDQDVLNPIQPLPDWPSGDRTSCMRPFQTFLIAMDVEVSGERFSDLVKWSGQAAPNEVPQTWTPDPTNSAGELSLGFLPGPVIDGAELRQQFYIYKRHSVWKMTLIGGTFIFQQQPVFSTFGALTRNCIVELLGQHLVITDGDIVLHDGTLARSIVNRRIKNELFRQISSEFFENTFAAYNRERNEVWCCFPTSEEFPTIAAVWDVDEDRWGLRDIPTAPHMAQGLANQPLAEALWSTRTSTWDTDLTSWSDSGVTAVTNSLMMIDRTNDKFQIISSEFADEDGQVISAVVRRDDLDFDTPTENKWISKLWPRIDAVAGTIIKIRVGAADSPGASIGFGPTISFTVGTDTFIDLDIQGKFISFEFSSDTRAVWRMGQFDVELALTGPF